MDDGAERAIVLADRARSVDRTRNTPAADAADVADVADVAPSGCQHAPGGERIAAEVAERWCERKDRAPAGRADGPARWMVEQCPTGGAGGGEDDREQRVREEMEASE